MEKLVRKKAKLAANSPDEPNTSKSSPFNNSTILTNLFEVGSLCPYKFSSKDIKNLRMISSQLNEIAKNFQIKILVLFYSKYCPYNPIMDDALDETRSTPCSIELHPHFDVANLTDQQIVAKYNRILQLHGQSVKTLDIYFWDVDNYIDNSKNFGLNIMSQLTSLTSIKLICDPFIHQFEFQKLKDILPNPNILQSIHIDFTYNSNNGKFHSYTNSLTNKVFKLFPSVTSLYYGHKMELYPTNAKEFLNRDPRIKFVKTNCPNDKVKFKFVEFIQENLAHMTLFETLIEQISQFATNVIVVTGDAEETHIFQSYLQKTNWTRLQKCTFAETKTSRFCDSVEGVQLHPGLCVWDSGEEYHLQRKRRVMRHVRY